MSIEIDGPVVDVLKMTMANLLPPGAYRLSPYLYSATFAKGILGCSVWFHCISLQLGRLFSRHVLLTALDIFSTMRTIVDH